MWAPNIEALSAAHRTFAVDQVSEFGMSMCTTPLRRFEDLVAWLDDLLDGLELKRDVDLLGISFGGALAAQYALRFPERLNKLVLIAPGNTVLRLSAQFMLRLIPAAVAARRFLPPMIRWIFADMERKDPQWVAAMLEQSFLNMRSLQPRKTPIPKVLTDAEWGSLKVSALFLVGEHEVIYSAKKAVRRLERVAPRVTCCIVPGAGHDLTVVQPELVNQRVLEFLRN
jgi:pimeloyl-ACP methyl ester carboxylesterase